MLRERPLGERNGGFAMVRSCLFLLTIAVMAGARAQEPAGIPAAVAHISTTKGQVSVFSLAEGRVVPANPGARVSQGDRLITGVNAKADLLLSSGETLRVGEESEIRFTQLLPAHSQLQLLRGAIDSSLAQNSDAWIEVDTPSVAIRPALAGAYRMTVKGSGESEILVSQGRLEIFGAGGSQWLESGQKMVVRGPGGNPEFRIGSGLSWWKRLGTGLASFLQSSGGISVDASAGGGGEEAQQASVESESRPVTENKPVERPQPSVTQAKPAQAEAHPAEMRSKTTDNTDQTRSAHSGESNTKTK
jgi:hypothetical protein